MEPFFCEDTRRAIEVLLFVADSPLTVAELAALAECDEETVTLILEDLREFYGPRGFHPVEIAGGWQFLTDDNLLPVVERLYKPKAQNLSRAAMETLAIVAYCQPVTRGEIEEIRGVNADHIVSGLLEKGLLEECGRRETPGRPILYGTSEKFLELLGLNTLADLPPVSNLRQEDTGDAEFPDDEATADAAGADTDTNTDTDTDTERETNTNATETDGL